MTLMRNKILGFLTFSSPGFPESLGWGIVSRNVCVAIRQSRLFEGDCGRSPGVQLPIPNPTLSCPLGNSSCFLGICFSLRQNAKYQMSELVEGSMFWKCTVLTPICCLYSFLSRNFTWQDIWYLNPEKPAKNNKVWAKNRTNKIACMAIITSFTKFVAYNQYWP